MTDRLAEIVLGLQRLAENARLRGDDLHHIQAQERHEHKTWLNHQLGMVREVYRTIENEVHRFSDNHTALEHEEPLPKAVTKGPAAVKAVG